MASSSTTMRSTCPSSWRRRSTICKACASTRRSASSTSSRRCLPSPASRSKARVHGRSLLPLMFGSASGGGRVRLRRVDGARSSVRMERAPLAAFAALQVHRRAAAGALRPRSPILEKRRTSSRSRRRSRRDGPRARSTHRRDEPRCARVWSRPTSIKETLERLASLGYVGTIGVRPSDRRRVEGSWRIRKTSSTSSSAVQRAGELMVRGEHAQAATGAGIGGIAGAGDAAGTPDAGILLLGAGPDEGGQSSLRRRC